MSADRMAWTHFVIGESGGEFAVRATCTNRQDASDAASMSAREFESVHVAEVMPGYDENPQCEPDPHVVDLDRLKRLRGIGAAEPGSGQMPEVSVITPCPECGQPVRTPAEGEWVTAVMPEAVAQRGRFIPVESLQVRDELICSLQTLLACYRTNSRPEEDLPGRIHALRIEHEKLMQADR